jgi:hypothetical protein
MLNFNTVARSFGMAVIKQVSSSFAKKGDELLTKSWRGKCYLTVIFHFKFVP